MWTVVSLAIFIMQCESFSSSLCFQLLGPCVKSSDLQDACHSTGSARNKHSKETLLKGLTIHPSSQLKDRKSPTALRSSESDVLLQRQAVSNKPSVLIRFIEQLMLVPYYYIRWYQ